MTTRLWCDCCVCHIAAETKRVGIKLILSEKGQEALIRTWQRTKNGVSYCVPSNDVQRFWAWTGRTKYTHKHTLFTYQWYSCDPSSHLLWQQQQLSDISFHYCSTPCLHHRWALDEARSTVNCQAELIGVWWRRREWLGNWNELEWKKRLREWDNLDTSTMLIWGFL